MARFLVTCHADNLSSAIMLSMTNDLQEHMNALERSAAYRVDRVIKQAPQEITEEVSFEGCNGAKLGPFVRKRIARESDLGRAYELLYEAQRASRRFLYLPHIRDYFMTEDELIVVMDWVTGQTLAEVVAQEDSSLEFAAPLFMQLCDAVSELHDSFDPPVIHRDITPSNVVVSAGVPTLIDLGIARSYNAEAALDTHQLGTFGYAAPEQYGFGQSDVRTDVYGLGMVLFFCCTGSTPDAQARARSFRAAGIPEEVSRVIEKATALTPADRYESVAALKRAFEEALQDYRIRLTVEKVEQVSSCLSAKASVERKAAVSPADTASVESAASSPDTAHMTSSADLARPTKSVSSSRGKSGAPSPVFPLPPPSGDSAPKAEHKTAAQSSPFSRSTSKAKSASVAQGSEVTKPLPSSPLPFVPALVWDIVLVLFWLLLMISMITIGTFEDPATGVKIPAMQKPFDLSFALLIITIPATLLFTTRPLQEFNPKWRLSWKGRLMILGCELCLSIALIILVSVFG